MQFFRSDEAQDGDLNTQRLEALSDGVFAIAITLLVLDIRLPETLGGGHAGLGAQLLSIWPSYFGYVLSFVTIGIYWVNHHYIFKLYKRTNHTFNLLNVLFLMFISFLPFPTAVLGKSMLNSETQHDAVIFYTFGLLLPVIGWLLMWFYAGNNYRLIDKRLDPDFVRSLTRQYLFSFVLYLAAVGIAVINMLGGLLIAAGITLLYLLPPPRPIYRDARVAEQQTLPTKPW